MPKAAAAEAHQVTVEETLLANALSHLVNLLRPYPHELRPKTEEELAVERAVASLRERGLVQGPEEQPNLTRTGIELARMILERRSAA